MAARGRAAGTANPTAGGTANLIGVDCVGASACSAVGNASLQTLIEAPDGATWTLERSGNPTPSAQVP